MLNYSENFIVKLKEKDEPFVLHFSADWCSTCLHQKKVLKEIHKDPDFKNLQVFTVDFDLQKKIKEELNVERQSVFVVFRGPKEMGRSLGVTDKEKISLLFKLGMKTLY